MNCSRIIILKQLFVIWNIWTRCSSSAKIWKKGSRWKQKHERIESSAPPPFFHHNLFTFNIRMKARKEENKSWQSSINFLQKGKRSFPFPKANTCFHCFVSLGFLFVYVLFEELSRVVNWKIRLDAEMGDDHKRFWKGLMPKLQYLQVCTCTQ